MLCMHVQEPECICVDRRACSRVYSSTHPRDCCVRIIRTCPSLCTPATPSTPPRRLCFLHSLLIQCLLPHSVLHVMAYNGSVVSPRTPRLPRIFISGFNQNQSAASMLVPVCCVCKLLCSHCVVMHTCFAMRCIILFRLFPTR